MIAPAPVTSLVDDELRVELGPNEELVWTGRPLAGLRLRSSDALLIPFSLMWGGFAFFWEFSVWNTNAPVFFSLWGIPFVVVGAYMIVGRFIVDAIVRSRTVYALTDYRALIFSGLVNRAVRSVDLRMLSEIGFSESRKRIGTITFGPPGVSGRRNSTRPPEFAFLENARAVYEKLRSIQADLEL